MGGFPAADVSGGEGLCMDVTRITAANVRRPMLRTNFLKVQLGFIFILPVLSAYIKISPFILCVPIRLQILADFSTNKYHVYLSYELL